MRINDITSDLEQPPFFFVKPPRRGDYHAARFREPQQQQYPQLANLAAPWNPDEGFQRVQKLVRQRKWSVVGEEPGGRRVQAIAMTALFRFRDDVVIEVRSAPAESGCVIAMRSKSRLGTGDWGTNARRIRAFFADLKAAP